MSDFMKYGDVSKRQRTIDLLNEGKTVEDNQTYITPTGKEIATIYFTQVVTANGKKQLFGMWQDITERKKAEEALHESEKQKAFLLQLSDTLRPLRDPVAIQKATSLLTSEYLDIGRTTYCEVRYEPDIIVYVPRDWTRHGMPSLAGGRYRADDFGPFINKMMSAGRTAAVADAESDPKLSSSERDNWRAINVVSNCSIPVLKEGKFVAYLAAQDNRPHYWTASEINLLEYVADISWMAVERANAESALRESEAKLQEYSTGLERLVEERTTQLKDSERLAAIGATAGMVGHDIRNPLQAIGSDVYLAKSDLSGMPESAEKEGIKESLEDVEKNIDYINKIVQDLQDYARPIAPAPREINLETLCEDVLFKNGVPENIDASCKVEMKAGKLVVDGDVLKRIMTNLVNNAVQAMPDGGKLSICTYRKDENTVIEISDTGKGIPEDIKPKLFTPLFTTKSKGQGFGLAVVKRMTEALGGTVTFESKAEEGTKFIVSLPPQKVPSKNGS